jgi:multiple sugar transport system permease protein
MQVGNHSIRQIGFARRRKIGKLAQREELAFYLFISPWLIGFLLFTGGPILAALGISFSEYSILQPPRWIGLENYQLLFADELFFTSLVNTLYYVGVSVPLGLSLAFMMAIALNQKVRGQTWFRTIFYLPSVVSGIVVALLWGWIFNGDFGLINFLLSLIGITGPQWLFSTSWAMPAFIIMSLWGVGGSMIVFLAGLQSIPEHLYEAAEIDGAGELAKFRHVTLPMMSPVIFFNMIVMVIGAFQIFDQVYIMTQGKGGPANATLVYVLYLYRNGFEYFKMGYASALAWILFLIILAITIAQFIGAKRWVYYEHDAEGGN